MSKDAPERVWRCYRGSKAKYIIWHDSQLHKDDIPYIRLDHITAKLKGLEEAIGHELVPVKIATSDDPHIRGILKGKLQVFPWVIDELAALRKEIES